MCVPPTKEGELVFVAYFYGQAERDEIEQENFTLSLPDQASAHFPLFPVYLPISSFFLFLLSPSIFNPQRMKQQNYSKKKWNPSGTHANKKKKKQIKQQKKKYKANKNGNNKRTHTQAGGQRRQTAKHKKNHIKERKEGESKATTKRTQSTQL